MQKEHGRVRIPQTVSAVQHRQEADLPHRAMQRHRPEELALRKHRPQ